MVFLAKNKTNKKYPNQQKPNQTNPNKEKQSSSEVLHTPLLKKIFVMVKVMISSTTINVKKNKIKINLLFIKAGKTLAYQRLQILGVGEHTSPIKTKLQSSEKYTD